MRKNEEYELDVALWPIMIVQDRYRGTYTGAQWIAIPQADMAEDLETTVWGDDIECIDWADSFIKKDKRVGIGDTPDQALSDLYTTAENFYRRETDLGDFMEPYRQIQILRDAIEAHRQRVLNDPRDTEAAEDELWAVLRKIR